MHAHKQDKTNMLHRTRTLVCCVAVALLASLAIGGGPTASGVVGRAEARSLLGQIPGFDLFMEVSYNILDTVASNSGDLLDNVNRRVSECLDGQSCPYGGKDPDAKRNVVQIIESRGFKAEEHDVITKDGYILSVQRIINPLVAPEHRAKLKPVILQHGLLSSSVDWVINSVDVRPTKWPAEDCTDDDDDSDDDDEPNTVERHEKQVANNNQLPGKDSQEHPNALGFYLANEGFDVFLGNSRGNVYGQRHMNLSSWQPKFWDFTFDEQIKFDLPDTIEFVQKLTRHTKVGYVGHSQGTTMAFGLLADRPEFADIIEPVVTLAPVAYARHTLSPVKYFAVYTPIFSHVNMWFGSSNAVVRYLGPQVCGPEFMRREICANIVFLSCGFDEAEFDESRASAYMAHMPSGTSVKNIAHWGQAVLSGRFAHFDRGILANQIRYNSTQPPAYDLGAIRSKSIVMFTAENDWLAAPRDVARLKQELRVKPWKVYNLTESVEKWNHIDFVYAKDAGKLVNTKIVEAMHFFK